MYFKDKYKDFVYTEQEIRKRYKECSGHFDIKVENECLSRLEITVQHHFNCVSLSLYGTRWNNLYPHTMNVTSKLGYIIHFLDDLLAPKESNPVSETVDIRAFGDTPIRVIWVDDNIVAIGNFLKDKFVLLTNNVGGKTLWEINV